MVKENSKRFDMSKLSIRIICIDRQHTNTYRFQYDRFITLNLYFPPKSGLYLYLTIPDSTWAILNACCKSEPNESIVLLANIPTSLDRFISRKKCWNLLRIKHIFCRQICFGDYSDKLIVLCVVSLAYIDRCSLFLQYSSK